MPKLSKRKTKPLIGEYLKAANILSDRQIEIILAEQAIQRGLGGFPHQRLNQEKQCNLKFGEIAINKGFTHPVIVDFFLEIVAI